MNIKDISTMNEIKQKEYSSDDQTESSTSSYNVNQFQKILLGADEKPDIIIEKILINIFNKYISPDINDTNNFDFFFCQRKIKILSLKLEKYQIIYYLLTQIRSLIGKYLEKIFELPNIIQLKEKFYQRYNRRSCSRNKNVSDNYINFTINRQIATHSTPKMKKTFDYYTTVRNLFYELKNIRNCLEKTAPIIEKIFEIPLSEFEKFSIYECEKEDYLKILIHDNFIWNEIIQNRHTKLKDLIDEITEDEYKNLNTMTIKIEYFKKLQEIQKINIDEMLKISKIGSSIDIRYPEDAKPIAEINYRIKEYCDNVTTEISNINYFPSNEEIDIDEITNIDDQAIQNNEINNIDEVTIYNKLTEGIISHNKSKDIKQSILKEDTINNINNIDTINIQDKCIISNLLKNKNGINNIKEKLEKAIIFNHSPNIHAEMNAIIDKNTKPNKIKLKDKEKIIKNKKEIKKENNNENNKNKINKKTDKKEIPSDIDDFVKYIVNDDKTETQNKKKKKNKKKNKKNKNEIKVDKEEEEINQNEQKEKEENDEIKDDLIKNSINRFKIHKIKFKYEPKWLETISNYP